MSSSFEDIYVKIYRITYSVTTIYIIYHLYVLLKPQWKLSLEEYVQNYFSLGPEQQVINRLQIRVLLACLLFVKGQFCIYE